MFAKIVINPFRSLTSRLTFTYAVLSCLLSALLLTILFFILQDVIRRAYDEIISYNVEEILYYYDEEGPEAVLDILKDLKAEENIALVLYKDGKVLGSTNQSIWEKQIIDRSIWSSLSDDVPTYRTIHSPHFKNSLRVCYRKSENGLLIFMALDGEHEADFKRIFLQISLILIGITLIFGSMIGWFLAAKAMRGVKEVTATAASISSGNFEDRVPHGDHPEEIEQLASTFNIMISRVHQLLNELKEVGNAIAHDLRRPLTHIRGNIEIALRDTPDISSYQTVMQDVIGECDRLEGMINTMLEIAALDAGVETLHKESVSLKALLLDAEDLFESVAEIKEQQLTLQTPSHSIEIEVDRSKIQRTIANLLDNAIKYTPKGGTIRIELEQEASWAVITIRDSGIGIPEEDLLKIFDLFYRCDKSRSQPGDGLGLSYVKTIIDNHGGTITATQPETGGTEFKIKLPLY